MDSQSSELDVVERAWAAYETGGPLASLEVVIAHAHEDIEARPYSGEGAVLHGAAEVRAFFERALAEGTEIRARVTSVEPSPDDPHTIISLGAIRVVHPDGSFAETQLRWSHHFRDGRIDLMAWEPRG
jgi:ketosteroid isomerase-like protein